MTPLFDANEDALIKHLLTFLCRVAIFDALNSFKIYVGLRIAATDCMMFKLTDTFIGCNLILQAFKRWADASIYIYISPDYKYIYVRVRAHLLAGLF